tara:strand:- start:129 stop:794 length:666 start_codon:yes stop_codon:yes gene_type:complete
MIKKISLVILFTIGLFSVASAEKGIKIGVSGQMGVFSADGKETEASEVSPKGEATAIIGYGSIFAEKAFSGSLSRLSLGVDYVPYALETETTEDNKSDLEGSAARATVINKVQVDFEDLLTFYASLNITENLYIKAGFAQVDVITNEKLGTGSAYGNTSLDGTVYGIGYNHDADNGMFFRVEGNVMEFDGASLTSTSNADNKVDMSQINGVSGKISIGRSF